MNIEIKLPELGEGVSEGELIKWLVKPGDSVKQDQAIAEVMTDKATVEVPTPKAGTIKELKYKIGDVIKVETTMILLETSGTASAPEKTAAAAPAPAPQKSAPAPMESRQASVGGASFSSLPAAELHVLATPSTRRLAREMNVDISQLSGTGLAGRVTREDIVKSNGSTLSPNLSPMSAPAQGPRITSVAGDERVPLRGVRKKIAENLQMAKQIIPHFTLMDEVEVSELIQVREGVKASAEKMGVKVTYLPFVIKALIATCRKFPQFNASIDDAAGEIVYKKHFNIGFAADTPQGLLVPVIKDADQKTILQLSQEILSLSQKARDGKLKPDEMKGATITITNIGSVGGILATPIINHPEVAILGMYKIRDHLSLEADGKIKVNKMMSFTITADHRLIDGAVAANFLKDLLAKIQSPGRLMLEMI